MPTEEPKIPTIQQASITVESHLVDVKSQSATKLQSNVEFQIDDAELLDKEEHTDTKLEKIIVEERRIEPRLSRYVKRHHPTEQIFGERNARPMTKRSSRGDTCLVSKLEPKTMKDALDNEDWILAMNEEIDQILKIKTWSLVPRPKGNNVNGTNQVFQKKT